MVNPGAFQGLRKQFLMNEKAGYRAAVLGGYAADALANIQRRYFRRFPIDLPHDQEPDGHALAAVNDNAPEEEPQVPDAETLTQEEYAKAVEELKERRRMIAFRKAQIKRWLAYQYMKDNDMDARESGKDNPYHWMLVKLSGMEAATKPRLRTPVNTWRKSQAKVIDTETRRVLGTLPKNQQAAARDRIAKNMFNKLSDEEKEEWAAQAKEEHEDRIARWKERMQGKASTDNADRQRAIQGLTRCMKPLLDMICEATGWKCSLIAGGPEPAHGGRLNILSIHSGETTGDVNVNFGRSERARYQQYFVPTYGDFLKQCYTPEECRSRALPVDEGFESLEDLGLDADGINLDSIGLIDDLAASGSGTRASSVASTGIQGSVAPADTSLAASTRVAAATGDIPNPSTHVLPEAASTLSRHSPSRAISPPAAPSPAPTPPASPSRSVTHAPAAVVSRSREISPFHAHSPAPTPPASPFRREEPTQGASRPQSVQPDPPALPTSPPAHTSGANGMNTSVNSPNSTTSPSSLAMDTSTHVTTRAERDGICPGGPSSTIPAKRVADNSVLDKELMPTSKRPRATASLAAEAPPAASTTLSTRSSTSASTKKKGSSSKNARTGTDTPAPKIPPWFTSAIGMLNSKQIDSRFATLVQTWSAFEKKENYKEIAVLERKGRPQAISDWIQRARRPTWAPKSVNINAFETEFRRWWYNLQPAWRREGDDVQWGSIAGDLEALRRPGTNGMLSVVAALYFWGTNIEKGSNAWDGYIMCLNDVQAVLSALVWPPASGSS